jgi:uncharacterized membrane protein
MADAPIRGDASRDGGLESASSTSPASSAATLLLVAAAVVGYALASHWLMLHAATQPWAVLVLLSPLLAAAGALLVRSGRMGAGLAVALLAAAVIAWRLIEPADATTQEAAVNRLYVAQHVGVHGLLLALFARSLRGPGLSLIGQLAQRVHALTPAMVAYTRSVTRMWCAYFAGMVMLSLLVYAFGSWPLWSLLANLGTPAAIAALFIGEYVVRYRLHPEFERTPLAVAVQAWRRRPPPG